MTAFHDLRSFVRALAKEGHLRRVQVEVDRELEITEIAARSIRQGGPALLFDNVRGSRYPLLINLLASAWRIERALGRHPEQIGEELVRFFERINPPSWRGLWRSRTVLRRLLNARTCFTLQAPVQENVESPDLEKLPIQKCWPGDAGRFVTFGLVLTEHPRLKTRNLGVYRMQVLGPSRTGMHWQIQKGGGFHYDEAEHYDRSLPLACIIGADPSLLLAAVSPLPEGMDEMAFAGFLRGSPTRVTRAETIPLVVPARAEFILEGHVPPREREIEGPFGDHFGHYSPAGSFPVFHIRKVTHRPHPIYLSTVVGKPPMEDRFLGEAVAQMVGPLIKVLRPEIRDLWAYYEAGFHNLLVVSVHQRYEKEAMKTALGLLGEAQLSLTKCVILVDPQVQVRNFREVVRAIGQHFDLREDLLILSGVPLDTLDFTSFKMNLGSKMVIDATRKPDARLHVPHPPQHTLGTDLKRLDERVLGWRVWENVLLVVKVRSHGAEILKNLVGAKILGDIKWVVLVSPDVDLDDDVSTLWGIFTRFDCARDCVLSEVKVTGPVVHYEGRLGMDATWKKGYPDPVEMPEEIQQKVTARWEEYGI